jgi:hypothetical protein
MIDEPTERETERLAARLETERPVPAVSFRGELGRRVAAHWAPPSRPARLWLLVAACALAGAALLLAAVLSGAGLGPLAP